MDKIILFTAKLYSNHHPFGGPILTLPLTVILSQCGDSVHE